jgi:hypothetical protein
MEEVTDGSAVLNAAKEIEKIQAGLADEQDKKSKKKSKEAVKEPSWMARYRENRYFHRFWDYLTTKWAVSRKNWLNLPGFAALFTNLLSIFTVTMLALAMYYSVEHLKKGSDFTLIVAGAILIGVLGWVNSRIGDGQTTNEENVSK